MAYFKYVQPVVDVVRDVSGGAANAYGTNLVLGVGRNEGASRSTAYRLGQIGGDALSLAHGASEATIGGGGEVAGLALDATGPGAVAGLPINVVSAGLIAHGGTVVWAGLKHLPSSINDTLQGGPSQPATIEEHTPSKGETTTSAPEPAKKGENGGAGAAEEKVPNPDGSKGAPDHQRATEKLVNDFQAKYPPEAGYEVRSNQSIKSETGLNRRPDAAAVKDNKVVEVGEVARTNADNETLVPRERLKQQQYKDAGIRSTVVKLPKKAQRPEAPAPTPTQKPPSKPEE